LRRASEELNHPRWHIQRSKVAGEIEKAEAHGGHGVEDEAPGDERLEVSQSNVRPDSAALT
jgi:hypothetical protein